MKLELLELSKSYGKKQALRDFTAELTPGIYGFLGPNGAGKSTLLNIITDNLSPDSGQVLCDGENIVKLGKKYRERLGYMPQQQGLYDSFTGLRFLWYMASLKGLSRSEAKAQIQKLLQVVNLESAASEKIGNYSGGMKQRLLVAQAMLGDPDVLILDEPTAGLDPKERIRIRNFISEMARDKIVIFATHVVSDVEFIAKEIMIIKQGELLYKAPVPELLNLVDGKVFEVHAKAENVEDLQHRYKVSNLSQNPEFVRVRIVSDTPPENMPYDTVIPDLEDLYIWLFEDAGT